MKGHLLALVTILVWGTTYIATKVLMGTFSPVEVLILRFLIAYLFLWIIHPKISRPTTFRRELAFALAGLTGVAGYQFLENIALQTTDATTMAVIISTAPIITTILAAIFLKDEKIGWSTVIGLVFCLAGVYLINAGGTWHLVLSWENLVLPLICAILWGTYDVAVKFVHQVEPDDLLSTRRIFFYGLLFSGIALLCNLKDFSLHASDFSSLKNVFWLAFLGILASGACFYTWNVSEKCLGAVRTSLYLDFQPVVTMIVAYFVLGEAITIWKLLGFLACLSGLLLANFASKGTKKKLA